MNTTPNSELVLTRDFDAPRALVYRAFTDADQIAAWFGPVGYSVPRETVSVDARVGGHQRFTMVSDENPAERSTVDATFVEVVEDALLVGEETWEGVPGLQDGGVMRMRVEFADADGGTRLTLRQGPYTAELVEMSRVGWESSFTKLDTLLKA